jgi:hypothetical protein
MDCTEFFANKYGKENIISAVVHMDETTPHLHLNIVPIVNGKLCSKDLFDKTKLSILQTEFYEKVGKKWGLERGKEGSQTKHLSTAEFKAKKIIESAEAQAAATKQQAKEFLHGIEQEVEDERNKPLPKKKSAVNEEITLLRTQNAAYKHDIELRNKDNEVLFKQLKETQRSATSKEDAQRMVDTIMKAFPDEFNALLEMSKIKNVQPRTRFNSKCNDKGGK